MFGLTLGQRNPIFGANPKEVPCRQQLQKEQIKEEGN